jgi:hypothetical protein
VRATLCALLLLGCAGPMRRLQPERVELVQLDLSFPEPGAGVLTLGVPVDVPAPSRLSWSVLLDGRPFASGLEAAPVAHNGVVDVRAPLTWRHLGWKEGARMLRVSVRGEVTWATRPDVLRFEGEREVLVQGAPGLEVRGEP